MKQSIKLKSCIAALLACSISCSKAPEEVPEAKVEQSYNKAVAQTSAVVGYWKDNTTSVTTIDVTPGNTKEVVYSIGPISVSANDVVTVHFQQQVSYAGTDPVMIGGGVVVGTNNLVKDQLSTGFVGFASNHSTINCTPEELGVDVVSRTGSYKFTSAANDIYINAVVYGANLSGNPPGALDVTLPSGTYGELVAVVESGVTRYQTNTQAFTSMAVSGTSFVNKTLGPYNILANTMVDVRYELEATTATAMAIGDYNQRLGRWVSQGTSATDQSGTRLFRPMQLGMTHYEHHGTVSHAGGLFYATAANNVFYNAILYGNGWGSATSPTYPLKIEQSTANNYGHYVVEMRSSSSGNFAEDVTRNVTTIDATPRVLYSVPASIAANQVVEIRYQAAFQPSAGTTVVSKIIRATSATATTGVEIQGPLARRFHNYYLYTNMVQSTAERPTTALTGQYYNVVVYRTNGASTLPVLDWGELEVVKR